MKANELIKKYGVEKARELVATAPLDKRNNYSFPGFSFWKASHLDICVDVQELKRLIESHELVSSFGGLEHAKRFLAENIPCADSGVLNKAIADVESCQ